MRKNNPLGVMQGRLLPKFQGRYQAHPVGYWHEEFSVAASLGLKAIEFILDYNDADENPLMNDEGINRIQSVSKASGVAVKSVCADYFMEVPLHTQDDALTQKSLAVLERLIKAAPQIGIRDIVIPCVDQSSLREKGDKDRLVERLGPTARTAALSGINLSLETDLAPVAFAQLLDRLAMPNVTVNYDSGNSASLGFDIAEEFAAYGDRISDIHIKDRVFQGGSVVLGTGAVDFVALFDAIEKIDYDGPVIMQAYRDDEGVSIFIEQLDWLKRMFGDHLSITS